MCCTETACTHTCVYARTQAPTTTTTAPSQYARGGGDRDAPTQAGWGLCGAEQTQWERWSKVGECDPAVMSWSDVQACKRRGNVRFVRAAPGGGGREREGGRGGTRGERWEGSPRKRFVSVCGGTWTHVPSSPAALCEACFLQLPSVTSRRGVRKCPVQLHIITRAVWH